MYPKLIYGTAWKETETEALTLKALSLGFRAIDTANQRKHYFEEGVGSALKKTNIDRDDLFLQSKFTYSRGQDHRKPYNENDSLYKQVLDSFASSLNHLNTNYLDSFLLHGPYQNFTIGREDLEVWETMEQLVNQNLVKFLGISNISSEQLVSLIEKVNIKPTFVQNRCFAKFGWDKEVRDICRSEKILYQGFSLLTANLQELASPLVYGLSEKYNKTIAQIVFRFAHQLDIIPLTGTTNPTHMQEDLNIFDFELDPSDVFQMEFDAF